VSGEDPGWDYRWLDASNERELDALGALGWDLVLSVPDADGDRLCLKRPRLTFRERVTLDQKRRVYAERGVPLPEAER